MSSGLVLVRRHKLVAGRCMQLGHNTDSGGTNTTVMGQQTLNTYFNFSDPILQFVGWGVASGVGEYVPSPSANMTLTASMGVLVAGGATMSEYHQAMKSGNPSMIVAPNAILRTDPIPGNFVGKVASAGGAAGMLAVRYFGSVTSTNKWVRGFQNFNNVNGLADYVAEAIGGSDSTMSGSLSYSAGADYCCSGVLGLTPTPQLAVALLGDSITWGQGDDATGLANPGPTTGDLLGNWGWAQRACFNNNVPALILAQSGDWASFNVGTNTKRQALLSHQGQPVVDWAVVMFGVNDTTNGQTYTQLKANLTSIVSGLHNRGIKVCINTISPHTTSTDSWATTGNQTPSGSSGSGSASAQVNADLRGGNWYGADMMYDFAAQCESSPGSWLWKTAGANSTTFDGLHPNTTVHQAIATDFATNALKKMYPL